MESQTKTIFNISKIVKIATDFKSLFTLDFNWGAFTNETTSNLIVYVNYIYMFHCSLRPPPVDFSARECRLGFIHTTRVQGPCL